MEVKRRIATPVCGLVRNDGTEGKDVKSLMRYKIISGRVVEKRDVLMEVSLDPTSHKRVRRGKRKGASEAAQIERNMNEAVKRLARVLNCNFGGGDLFLSLKYSDERLPGTKQEAKRLARNFMRRICRAYLAATGEKLRWVLVTADRSSKTGASVRLHHHIVMDAVAWELIAAHWPGDQFSYRRLDGSGDYTAIARYMVRNAGYAGHKGPQREPSNAGHVGRRGAAERTSPGTCGRESDTEPATRTWSTSQGLEKPVFTSPEPVKGAGSFQVPKEARIVEREVRQDEESGFYGAYIRYILPSAERAFPDTARRGRSGADTGATIKYARSSKAEALNPESRGLTTERNEKQKGRPTQPLPLFVQSAELRPVAEGVKRDKAEKGGGD